MDYKPLYRVYVIENQAGRRYIGFSEDADKRLEQHNAGQSSWTAKYRPWKLIWRSEFLSRSDALKLEKKLKRQGRGSGFYTLTGLVPPGS
jgi:putative endonuclease